MSDPPSGDRRCVIVVPVYNEVAAIAETIAQLQATAGSIPDWRFDIVCVDDGSTDGSGEILDGLGDVRVLRHAKRQGYGASLCHAIDESDHEWVFIVDADGTYPLVDLPRFCAVVDANTPMVIGRRIGEGIHSHPFRRVARWILRVLVFVLAGTYLSDLNSGMRLFRRDLYARFRALLPRGFSFTTTITVASLYHRLPISFVDIDYARRVGTSTIRPVPDFVSFVLLIVRLATLFEPMRFYLPATALTALLGAAVYGRLSQPYRTLTLAVSALATLAIFTVGWSAHRHPRRQRRAAR
jgi:glycosyltransferase involved in cell wall biosynthesis